MKTVQLFSLITFMLIIFGTNQTFSQNSENQKIVGKWQGDLALPNGAKITMVFKVTEEAGNLKAGMDVPAQGAKDIPVEKVVFSADSASFNVKLINGIFSGKLTGEGKILDGKWVQNGITLPLKLEKTDKSAELKRPQEPLGPFPYKAEDVTYENKEAGIKLAGTLTLPSVTKKSPAVILISGSGAQNRNEEIFGHKPFLVIADFLTRKGIAVLRVDDRGVGGSTGKASEATSEDFAGDVLSGIEYLKKRPEVDMKKIGLIGHSEGGLIAPKVAIRSKDIAFIVLLAGPGLRGDSILVLQVGLLNRAMGEKEEDVEKSLRLQREINAIIVNSKDDKTLNNQLQDKFKTILSSLTEEEKNKLGNPENYINMQIKALTSPWFKYFVKYDPQPTLQKVKCPVLALNGEKDLQVPPDENLQAIGETLKKARNKNYKTLKLAGLNHLFQTCKTGLIAEYGEIEETFSPDALKTIGDWVIETVK